VGEAVQAGEPNASLVPIAAVARPHGVRGELRLKLYNPDSELLLGRPPIRLIMPDGSRRAGELLEVRSAPGALLVRIEGVDDRDAADALRGAEVAVDRAELGPVADGEYYFCDLEGCRVGLEAEPIGSVLRVMSYPTCEVLLVAREGKPALEVPFTERYVGEVNIAARSIVLATIDGLE